MSQTMSTAESMSLLGISARLGIRALFLPRYCVDNFHALRYWHRNTNARARFGASFRWRFWLLCDCKELENLEEFVNEGSDEHILRLRETQLELSRLVALVVCTF
jgi:hypothetical protein